MAAMNSFSMLCSMVFRWRKKVLRNLPTLVMRVSGLHACSENRTARQSIHCFFAVSDCLLATDRPMRALFCWLFPVKTNVFSNRSRHSGAQGPPRQLLASDCKASP